MNKTQEALNEGEQMKNNAAMEDHWGNNPRFKKALADSALDRMAENARELGLDYESIVEQVEDSVGMGHKAWDMVDPKELAKGFHEAFAEPPCKTGSQCTSKCQQCEQPAQQRHISYVCPQCHWSLEEQPAQPKLSDYEPDGMHHNKPQKRPQNCGTGYCSCIECLFEQPEQEPVAYIHRHGNHWEVSERFLCDDEKARGWTEEPLYTSPQPASKPLPEDYTAMEQALTRLQKRYAELEGKASKPWVGLTEQERNDLEDYCEMIIGKAAFEAIEAKLKEKNNE